MKHMPRQEVLNDRNYSTAPLQFARPSLQGDSYRNMERPSHTHLVVENKENAHYKMQQMQQMQQYKRPQSSTNDKMQQHQQIPRPYSSSYDKRDKGDPQLNGAPPGFLNQLHAPTPSAPTFKKPLPVDNRGSIKKEATMKSSLMINQYTYSQPPPQPQPQPQTHHQPSQQPHQQFSQQKQNRFFSNNPEQQQSTYLQKADDRPLYSSVPQEIRAKPHFSHKPGPSGSFIENQSIEVRRKNETEGPTEPKRTQEYQEYRKLQDKLQYLENKIISIKSNIDNSNSQLAKNSSRMKKDQNKSKQGLTAKFFNNKKTDTTQTSITPTAPTSAPSSNKPKHKAEQSTPSLSTFITQVKPSGNGMPTPSNQPESTKRKEGTTTPSSTTNVLSSAIKNLLNKPESAKAQANSQKQKSFTRKTSQETQMMKYSSMSNLTTQKEVVDSQFLFYVSSVIKAFMSQENFKPYEQAREHLVQSIQAIQFSKSMRQTPPHQIDERRVILPKREIYRNKKSLIFDLDETLIHCNESVQVPGDVYLPIRFPTGELIEASVNIRPYATTILENLSKHFEIIVFTASHSCYANVVLDYLDPHRQWISHRLFRESCVQSDEGAYIKDLRVFGNRSLSEMLLIDNAAYSFGFQIANGVPILPYYENKQDQELLHLQNYLMQFRNVRDMRELNSKSLRVENYSDFNDPIELLQTLFKEYIPQI